MSQVGISRPPTTQSLGRPGPVLPEIQHPLSRLSNPEKLDIRGSSQDGRPATTVSASGRSLAAEPQYKTSRSRGLHSSGSGRIPSRLSLNNINSAGAPAATNIETIPEGVEVIQGDPSKTRLPLFGKYLTIFYLQISGWYAIDLRLPLVTQALYVFTS